MKQEGNKLIRILTVEDERAISNLIRMSLEKAGYSCTCAYDGAEAAELLEHSRYDLILLDIMLPKLTGLEVCQQIREFSNVPIIMLTAKDNDMDKIMGLEYGADDYIMKPFDEEIIVSKLEILDLL